MCYAEIFILPEKKNLSRSDRCISSYNVFEEIKKKKISWEFLIYAEIRYDLNEIYV